MMSKLPHETATSKSIDIQGVPTSEINKKLREAIATIRSQTEKQVRMLPGKARARQAAHAAQAAHAPHGPPAPRGNGDYSLHQPHHQQDASAGTPLDHSAAPRAAPARSPLDASPAGVTPRADSAHHLRSREHLVAVGDASALAAQLRARCSDVASRMRHFSHRIPPSAGVEDLSTIGSHTGYAGFETPSGKSEPSRGSPSTSPQRSVRFHPEYEAAQAPRAEQRRAEGSLGAPEGSSYTQSTTPASHGLRMGVHEPSSDRLASSLVNRTSPLRGSSPVRHYSPRRGGSSGRLGSPSQGGYSPASRRTPPAVGSELDKLAAEEAELMMQIQQDEEARWKQAHTTTVSVTHTDPHYGEIMTLPREDVLMNAVSRLQACEADLETCRDEMQQKDRMLEDLKRHVLLLEQELASRDAELLLDSAMDKPDAFGEAGVMPQSEMSGLFQKWGLGNLLHSPAPPSSPAAKKGTQKAETDEMRQALEAAREAAIANGGADPGLLEHVSKEAEEEAKPEPEQVSMPDINQFYRTVDNGPEPGSEPPSPRPSAPRTQEENARDASPSRFELAESKGLKGERRDRLGHYAAEQDGERGKGRRQRGSSPGPRPGARSPGRGRGGLDQEHAWEMLSQPQELRWDRGREQEKFRGHPDFSTPSPANTARSHPADQRDQAAAHSPAAAHLRLSMMQDSMAHTGRWTDPKAPPMERFKMQVRDAKESVQSALEQMIVAQHLGH
ncbi:hypothetical protein CYMTET_44260 [Cymbomonas tetramitiformis]|uniref:Uncharacterized protein n=1 Tax=Cymbomonas tetramitiformis TaxID=36881 RepID=A0AAE0C2M8_9CHLO|nr:hypothetical protein CYMTET_44260 [Cymbomonas tetramitiformis]